MVAVSIFFTFMKTLDMKFTLSIFLIFGSILGISQTNSKVSDQTKEQLREFSKELFDIDVSMNFNISSKDLKTSFNDMKDGEVHDDDHLKELMTQMGEDTLNPLHLNNLGVHYTNNKNQEKATFYYSSALSNMHLKYFDYDSAFYYSFRGVLKMNLNDTNAIKDFDVAVSIDPTDSITMFFYPMVLISRGNFDKAKEVVKKTIEQSDKQTAFSYLFLTIAEVFNAVQSIMKIEDEKEKKDKVKLNFDEITDYAALEKYLKLYKDNQEVKNCRLLSDLLGLFYKVVLFEQDSTHNLKLNYSNYEKEKIKEIISEIELRAREQRINLYTANKAMAYAYFMIEKRQKSLLHFQMAIDLFPKKKSDMYFNPADCYEAVSFIHYLNQNMEDFRSSVKTKMDREQREEDKINELINLAIEAYKSGNHPRAKSYSDQIRTIEPDNFNTLRLLSQLYFEKGVPALAQYYFGKAKDKAASDIGNYDLLLQFAVYQTYNGDFANAKGNIEIARKIENVDSDELCNRLLRIIEGNQ